MFLLLVLCFIYFDIIHFLAFVRKFVRYVSIYWFGLKLKKKKYNNYKQTTNHQHRQLSFIIIIQHFHFLFSIFCIDWISFRCIRDENIFVADVLNKRRDQDEKEGAEKKWGATATTRRSQNFRYFLGKFIVDFFPFAEKLSTFIVLSLSEKKGLCNLGSAGFPPNAQCSIAVVAIVAVALENCN